jgi:hypothetical protein
VSEQGVAALRKAMPQLRDCIWWPTSPPVKGEPMPPPARGTTSPR